MKSKKADDAFVYENLLEEAAEQLKALGHPLRLPLPAQPLPHWVRPSP